MQTEPIEQLALWMNEAQQRLSWNVCLVPGEPVIYRGWRSQGRTCIERAAGDILSAQDIERVARAVFDAERLTRLGREEMDVLTRHGGALVEARIRRYAPELIGA